MSESAGGTRTQNGAPDRMASAYHNIKVLRRRRKLATCELPIGVAFRNLSNPTLHPINERFEIYIMFYNPQDHVFDLYIQFIVTFCLKSTATALNE